MTHAVLSSLLVALLCASCLLTAIPEEMLSGGPGDAGSTADANVADAATTDTAAIDMATTDAVLPDAGSPVDGATPDTAAVDRTVADQARPDLAQLDRVVVDAGSNTPPVVVARFVPELGTTATTFSTDTSGTFDREDSVGSLVFRWDFDRDGTFEATGAVQTHAFGTTGIRHALLDVADSGGLHTQKLVVAVVVDASTLIEVTTSADENDASATPAAPGGSGLSLREAITYVNAQGGNRSIQVPASRSIALASGLPALTTSYVSIVGDSGASVDGSGLGTQDCLVLTGSHNLIAGLLIRNCPANAIFMTGDSNQVARCRFEHNRNGVWVYSGSALTVGPDNLFTQNSGYSVHSEAAAVVKNNLFRDNGDDAVRLAAGSDGSLIVQNVFRRNPTAVAVIAPSTGSRIVHNVVDGHSEWPLLIGANADAIGVQNNIFTSNLASSVINGRDSAFAAIGNNDFYGNANGNDACTCSNVGANNQLVDPHYVDAAAEDLRLRNDSPLLNAGIDIGIDVNGPLAGNYNGSAPDIGANEAP